MKYDFEKFRKYFGEYAEAPAPWSPPVGAGWHGIIHDALVKIDVIVNGDASRFRIEQIKEKFGSLCFYHTADASVRDELDAIEIDLEEKSERMCEECRAPAEVHDYKSWYKCWCPTHAAKFIFEHKVVLGARGWKLDRIGERAVLIDKETGAELGDAKFREIDARVETNRATQQRESEADMRVSSVKSSASAEIKHWRHARFVARR
jgi:hypothetical protein